MRIDVFLPFLKKAKKGLIQTPTNWLTRGARAVLPAALFSDLQTGKPGLIRRLLKRIGPTWHSAPLRRVVQGTCLVLFLVLFFYVCWPYTARPTRTWQNWVAAEADLETQQVKFLRGEPDANLPRAGQVVYGIDASLPPEETSAIAPARFEVLSASSKEMLLKSAAAIPPEGLSPGPWFLHESLPGAWPAHYTEELQRKERISAELFLTIDPLVSLSTGIASRSWVWSLTCAAIILAVCIFIPRGFCGYL